MGIISFSDFSGGLYESQALKIYGGPTSLLQAQNIEYFVDGKGEVKIRGRRAVNRINSTVLQDPSAASYVRSLYKHSRRSGARTLLAVYENSAGAITFKHDTDANGVFEAITGVPTTTTGARWHFATWPSQDATYMVSTAAAGADGLRKYDPGAGTPITTISPTGISVDGPYITVWKDRLWVTKASELNYSVYASSLNDPTTFLATNQLSVNDPEGGIITGLVAYGDSLLIFKNTGIWRFTGDIEFSDSSTSLTQYCNIGCIAPETIEVIPGQGVVYLGQYGLRMTDGQDPEGVDLSHPLASLFIAPSTQTAYTYSFGKYFPRKKKYYLFLNSSSATVGVAPTPYILTFLSTNPTGKVDKFLWSKDSWLQTQANTNNSSTLIFCLAAETSDGDTGKFFAGDDDGIVWEVDVGSSDTNSSTTYSIFPVVQTPFLPMDTTQGGLRLSRGNRLYVEYRGKMALSCEIRYDQNYSTQASLVLGQDLPSYKFQQVNYAITQHGRWGRTASLLFTLPSDSYETELNQILFSTIQRGGRARINVAE